MLNPQRPLHTVLGPEKTYETWCPVAAVPDVSNAEGLVRVRLSNGKVVKGHRNDKVPPRGRSGVGGCQGPLTPTRPFTGSCCAAATMRRRSVHRMTDDAEAAELEPSEELLAARALETGLVEEDETYIYTPDDLQDSDVAADHVWLQKGTGRKVYLVKKEHGPASQA